MNDKILVHTLEDIGQDNVGLQVVVLSDGQAFCTQSSYSRYAGVDRTTITKRCQNYEKIKVEDLNHCESIHSGLIETMITTTGNYKSKVTLIPADILWLAIRSE